MNCLNYTEILKNNSTHIARNMTFQIQTVSDIQRKNNIFRQKNDIKKEHPHKECSFVKTDIKFISV